VNSEDVFGLIVLLVGLWESHQTHQSDSATAMAPADRQVSPTTTLAGAAAQGLPPQAPALDGSAGETHSSTLTTASQEVSPTTNPATKLKGKDEQ